MAQRAVRHLFVEGIAKNVLELVEMVFLAIPIRHLDMPLAKVASPITVFPENIRVQRIHRISAGQIRIPGVP